MLSVCCTLAPYVDTSGISCNMNWLSECYLSFEILGGVEFCRNIGMKYIKINLELCFYSHLCICICIYVHFLFVYPLDTGGELGVQQDFQNLSRVS